MNRLTKPACIALFAVILVSSAVVAANSKSFIGNWVSDLDYGGTTYTLELSLAQDESGDKLTGNLRILDAGYLVETLGFKSMALDGDSLVIQTESIDGRAAKFALSSGKEALSGMFWETNYSGKEQGQGLEMVFKQKKE